MTDDDTLLKDHLLPIGYRLDEFEILSVLGEGGFGVVYQVHDHRLNQLRALKEFFPTQIAIRAGYSVYPKKGAENQAIYRKGLESFVHEAQMLAAIDHPNIVRVYRCIEANHTAYLVMHYCKGETLEAWAQTQLGMPTTDELTTLQVFYSYAHEDRLLRDELEKHLSLLKRQGMISGWSDRDITAGRPWKNQIDQNLESAHIILLLVSADFLNSDYCYDIEMQRALQRQQRGEAEVIPVILRPVVWQDAPFGQLQALPIDGLAVTSWPNRDEAFVDIVQGIRKAALALKNSELKAKARCPAALSPDPLWLENLLSQLLDGLQVIHEQGILHRDIKPSNIYLIDSKRPVLIDFGAARRVVGEMTHSPTSIWTPGYAPIEQYGEEATSGSLSLGPWSDIYSLAATLYRIIRGSKPPEPHLRLLQDELAPLTLAAAKKGYRQALLRSIDKALAVKPAERFQTVAQWRAALDANVVELTPPPDGGRMGGGRSESIEAPDLTRPHPNPSPLGEGNGSLNSTVLALDAGSDSGKTAKIKRSARLPLLARWAGALALLAAASWGGYFWIGLSTPGTAGSASEDMGKSLAKEVEPEKKLAQPEPAAGQIVHDCPGCPEMVWIPGGTFQMGSDEGEADEKPRHAVTVKGFYLGKFEVTKAQFAAFADETGLQSSACWAWDGKEWKINGNASWRSPGFAQTDEHPVVCVSAKDAQAYADWLSRKTGKHYRLPTESEWEYACRAGQDTRYSGGNDVDSVAWYDSNSGNTTHSVGGKQGNKFGLFDMSGNVWEWTCSAYTAQGYAGGGENTCAKGAADSLSLRGGAWDAPRYLRCSYRVGGGPNEWDISRGFRLAKD